MTIKDEVFEQIHNIKNAESLGNFIDEIAEKASYYLFGEDNVIEEYNQYDYNNGNYESWTEHHPYGEGTAEENWTSLPEHSESELLDFFLEHIDKSDKYFTIFELLKSETISHKDEFNRIFNEDLDWDIIKTMTWYKNITNQSIDQDIFQDIIELIFF